MIWKRVIYTVTALELILIAVAAPAIHRRLESPKAKEQRVASSPTMIRAFVAPKPTNHVSRTSFAWGYDQASMPDVDHFILRIGTNEGVYTIEENAGTNLTYVFTRTNWSEAKLRHFAVVIAVSPGDPELNSAASNETHWPVYPPDHVMLSWTTKYPTTRVLSSHDISKPVSQWGEYASVNDATNFSAPIEFTTPAIFFAVDKPEQLSVLLFNPNP